MSGEADLRYPLTLGSEEYTSSLLIKEFSRDSRTETNLSTIIQIYMPKRLQNPNTIGWDPEKLGIIGGFINNMINGGAMSGGTTHGINAGMVQSGLMASGYAAKMMGFNSGENLYKHTTKTIPSSFSTMIFKGVDFRTFEFSFEFYPKSPEEAAEIDKIIKTLRGGAYPERPANGDPYYLRYPNEYELEYLIDGQPNRFLNKFKRCVIVSIDVDYTATGMFAIQRDGFPTLITMNIRFSEIEIVTRGDIREDGF